MIDRPGGVKTEFAPGKGRNKEPVRQSNMLDAGDVAAVVLMVCTPSPKPRIIKVQTLPGQPGYNHEQIFRQPSPLSGAGDGAFALKTSAESAQARVTFWLRGTVTGSTNGETPSLSVGKRLSHVTSQNCPYMSVSWRLSGAGMNIICSVI